MELYENKDGMYWHIEPEDIIKRYIEENSQYKFIIKQAKQNNQRIIDYGFDYDGFNNVEDLKKLIDMLVDYAKQTEEILGGIEND